MLQLAYTLAFKRDYKREAAGQFGQALDDLLKEVTSLLCAQTPLSKTKHDHPLKGGWKGFRECHLKPDLLLIYRKTKTSIELTRLGSHAELFG